MYRKVILLAAFVAALTVAGCSDNTKTVVQPEATGTVTFNFDNYVGTTPVTLGTSLDYTNPSGTKYSISMLRYVISDLVMHRSDGQTFGMDGYHYRDQGTPSTRSFTLDNIPRGTYDMVSFTFGLDAEKNVFEKYNDDITFQFDMFWPFDMGGKDGRVGYHYMRIEGNFELSPDSVTTGYTTHTGARWLDTDTHPYHHFFRVYVPITATKIDGDSWEVTIKLDANGWYEDPTPGDSYDTEYDWHDLQGTPMGQMMMGNLNAQDKLMTNGPHCFAATIQKRAVK